MRATCTQNELNCNRSFKFSFPYETCSKRLLPGTCIKYFTSYSHVLGISAIHVAFIRLCLAADAIHIRKSSSTTE